MTRTIDSTTIFNNKVGVGVTPTAELHVSQDSTTGNALAVTRDLASTSTNAPLVNLIQDNSGDDQVALRLQQDGTGDIVNIFDGALEVFTILDGGGVSIGNPTPTTGHILSAYVEGANAIASINSYGTSFFSALALYSPRGTTASPSANLDGDILGSLYFGGWDTALSNGARIYAVAAANWGDAGDISDNPTDLFFATVPDGSNTMTDRMVIMSDGLVGIGQFTPTATLHVTQTATTGDALRVTRDLAAASTNSPLVNLIQDNTGDDQVALRIQQDGTGNILTCLDANAEVLTVVDGGAVFVRPGTASDTAKVGGTLLVSTTQTGNAGAGEDQLLDYTLPANTLAANGQGIRVEAFGTIANNANSKKILFRFGSSGTNLVLDTGLSFASAAHVWELVATVIRTGSATQKAYCKITVSDNSTFTIAEKVGFSSALDQTLSSIVAVRINGQGVDNNDVVIEGARITWFGENT